MANLLSEALMRLLAVDGIPSDNCIISNVPPSQPSYGSPSQCFLSVSALTTIFTTPDYPRPQPAIDIRYRIAETNKLGLGMFAARSLQMGTLILTERPLIVTPAFINDRDFPRPCLFSTSFRQIKKETVVDWETVLQKLLERLPKVDRKAFLRLSDAFKDNDVGKLAGIVQTNSLMIPEIVGGDYEEGDCDNSHFIEGCREVLTQTASGEPLYRGTCLKLSRVNHSCRPNAVVRFDTASFCFKLIAIRDITAKEEITIHICELAASTANRQKSLATRGFKCLCHACADPDTDISDFRRQMFPRIVVDLDAILQRWIHVKHVKLSDLLTAVEVWKALVEAEGMQADTLYGKLLRLRRLIAIEMKDTHAIMWSSIPFLMWTKSKHRYSIGFMWDRLYGDDLL